MASNRELGEMQAAEGSVGARVYGQAYLADVVAALVEVVEYG